MKFSSVKRHLRSTPTTVVAIGTTGGGAAGVAAGVTAGVAAGVAEMAGCTSVGMKRCKLCGETHA